jgi:exonuclease SbcC
MGLNVFDKLYETGLEDIKEVSVLIKNFKRNDFTTELADKANDLKEKKGELKELDKELNKLNGDKDGLDSVILELSRNLTPIDGNLNIDDLNTRKEKLKSDIEINEIYIENKVGNINAITEKMVELLQSVNEKKQSNGIDIEIVYSNYQREQKSLIEATKVYDTAKVYLRGAEEKIKHLDKHEYDPNCKFCCDNTFVKDAMKSKEALPQLQEIVKQAMIDCVGIQQTLDTMEGIEEQYNEWNDFKNKLEQSKSIHKTYVLEFDGLNTKKELLETQLDNVEDDIEKYYENEDTIQSNKELESQIKQLETEKKRFESDIKDITKQIATTNGSISSLQTYIDSIKQKMNEVKDLEEKNRLYTYYLDAVKRDGIPYELISKALPVIENEVNNILAQVVDFGVTMEMDGKSINAKIVYEDQEWPLEMCSGMEKFVSGLAIRVALINVCNLPRPNFLVVDEGFGTLDADNLSSLFMMMQYLKTQFDFIWVISHLEQMRDIVDGLIEIKKVNGFSKIDF